MKDLFQIQTESGQLWLDIKAQLDAKDAAFAELSAECSRLAALQTENEKKLAAAVAKKAEAEAEIAKLKA